MATLTTGYSWTSGDTVTPALLNQMVNDATVTFAAGEIIPTGAIMAFGRTSAPTGWLVCDGQAVSRTDPDYVNLFSAIGTTWGAGNGSTTFNVPNLGDRYLRHKGATHSGNVGTTQADLVKNHTHSGNTGNDTPDHSHGYTVPALRQEFWGSNPVNVYSEISSTSTGGASTRHTHPFTTGNPDSNGGAENRPLSATVLYCIKL